jgi:protein-disulfide isomerase
MEEKANLTKKEKAELKRENKKDKRMRQIKVMKTKKYFFRALVLFFAVFAVFAFWKSAQEPKETVSLSPSDILQVKSDDWVKGNPNAPLVLVEYLDFECEACRAYYPLVKRLSDEYKDDLFVVSRYFPLSGHKNGMTSALAIEAAGRQGKYWEIYNLLFENQKKWGKRQYSDPSIFEEYAKQLDLDIEKFKKDMDSQEVKDRVIRDRESGIELDVRGTPTFFLNGKKIKNPRGYEAFKLLLDQELKK